MNRKILMFLLSLFLCVSVISCFDQKDFELDKLSTSDITPLLHIPLFKDSLYMEAGTNIKYVGDTAAFYFKIDEIALPGLSDMLKISPASVTISGSGYSPLGGNFPPVALPVTTVLFPPTNDEKIETVQVVNMPFSIANECSFQAGFAILIPELTPNTPQTFTLNPKGSAGSTKDVYLSGTLNLVNNSFTIQGTFTASNVPAGDFTYGTTVSFSIPTSSIKYATGYFGQSTYSASESVEIAAFDKIIGKCDINAAYLDVTATNYTGVPLLLTLDKVTAGTNSVSDVGSITIAAASSSVTGKITTGKDGRIGGTQLAPIINAIISGGATRAGFSFSSKSNPNGEVPGQKNFITNATTSVSASGEVVVPMVMAIEDLLVKDTMDLSFPDYNFLELGAKVYAKNSMPVGVTMQAILLKDVSMPGGPLKYEVIKNGADTVFLFPEPIPIKPAQVDASGVVTSPEITDDVVVSLDPLTIQKLKTEAKKIVVQLHARSPEGKKVIINDKNYIKVQVGLEAKVSVKELTK